MASNRDSIDNSMSTPRSIALDILRARQSVTDATANPLLNTPNLPPHCLGYGSLCPFGSVPHNESISAKNEDTMDSASATRNANPPITPPQAEHDAPTLSQCLVEAEGVGSPPPWTSGDVVKQAIWSKYVNKSLQIKYQTDFDSVIWEERQRLNLEAEQCLYHAELNDQERLLWDNHTLHHQTVQELCNFRKWIKYLTLLGPIVKQDMDALWEKVQGHPELLGYFETLWSEKTEQEWM